MSDNSNTNVLETASELIDILPNGSMKNSLVNAVNSNDLEEVYYLNQSIIAGMAEAIIGV